MKISVKAKTKAKEEKVEKLNQPSLPFSKKEKEELPIYKVSVKEAPEHGKANIAIIKLLSKYFDVPYSSITLISGQTSKQKVFEIFE
ncbi:MAG: DUF167 domain-containing protein [Candidatus Paceibacterota bacterium]|jgi:hypothetical protein